MFLNIWTKIKNSPSIILLNVFCLLTIGFFCLYSISIIQEESSSQAFYKQLFFLGPAFLLMIFTTVLSKRFIHKNIYLLYVISLFLISLPFYGSKVAGTHRWIDYGLPFLFQPSEIAKWVIVITLARFLSDNNLQVKNFLSNVIPFVIALIPTLIVLNQPDLGTAFIMMLPVIPMLYWVGANPFHLFLIVAPFLSILTAFNVIVFTVWIIFIGIIIFFYNSKLWNRVAIFFLNVFLGLIFPLIWNLLRPYQKNRILSSINPELDPLGAGYQVIQSKTALGSGGFFGKGLGQGTQTQLKFLPVQESDFIVSVIGEELGFVVIILMLFLFASLLIKMTSLAFHASDRFSSLIIIGITSIFLGHIFVNCSMTAGLIPVKGLPLPFISYGGSFLLSSFMMIGFILNFGRTEP